MIIIPAIHEQINGIDTLVPQTPIPTDAIMVTCDGANYAVYQPGDTVSNFPVTPS